MTRLDEFRLLDPVDPDAAAPDGEALLQEILRSGPPPQPPRRHRRRSGPRLRVLAGAVACATAAGVVLAMPGGTGTDVVAEAYDAVHQPGSILHYTQRWTDPGSRVSPQQTLGTVEVWQAGDGSRQRVVQNLGGISGHESVLDADGSRTYVPERDAIIEYDERAERPAEPAGVGRPDLGDPRELLERTRSGDETVTELGEATVRGIPVLQFRVGECRIGPLRQIGKNGTSQEIGRALIVSVDRDDFTPVRVEEPPCETPPADAEGLRLAEMPGVTLDYLHFDVLPATEENQRLLELSPHPGAPVLDGERIDAEEERAEG